MGEIWAFRCRILAYDRVAQVTLEVYSRRKGWVISSPWPCALT
jgi:hypothetical protein